jgi:hypothetical protein
MPHLLHIPHTIKENTVQKFVLRIQCFTPGQEAVSYIGWVFVTPSFKWSMVLTISRTILGSFTNATSMLRKGFHSIVAESPYRQIPYISIPSLCAFEDSVKNMLCKWCPVNCHQHSCGLVCCVFGRCKIGLMNHFMKGQFVNREWQPFRMHTVANGGHHIFSILVKGSMDWHFAVLVIFLWY